MSVTFYKLNINKKQNKKIQDFLIYTCLHKFKNFNTDLLSFISFNISMSDIGSKVVENVQ